MAPSLQRTRSIVRRLPIPPNPLTIRLKGSYCGRHFSLSFFIIYVRFPSLSDSYININIGLKELLFKLYSVPTELSGERSQLRVYDRRKHRRVWRAQRALAHILLFIELAGERIVATEASTKLSFLFFLLVGYSILCT